MIQSSGNDPIPNHHRFASPRGAVDLSGLRRAGGADPLGRRRGGPGRGVARGCQQLSAAHGGAGSWGKTAGRWIFMVCVYYIYMQISQKAVSFRSGELMMLILHVIYDHRQVGFKAHGWIPQTLE